MNQQLNHERELIILLDFGAQYSQLIARRVRSLNVYCEIMPHNADIEKIKAQKPKGIILSGGPASVLDEGAPRCDKGVFNLGVPVLGICYGMQLTAQTLGGTVESPQEREYGRVMINLSAHPLFEGMASDNTVWMSHTLQVVKAPQGFVSVAGTPHCPWGGMANDQKRIYGIQFHPEVTHTPQGMMIFDNFLRLCGCQRTWKMASYIEEACALIREQVGDKSVLLGLSGGVDSAVAASLLYKAVGEQLTCVFVDHGLLRKNEREEVEAVFRPMLKEKLLVMDARERFLDKLAGVVEPEQKRKIIGKEFVECFRDMALQSGKLDFLAQGTIYPDVIESGVGSSAAVIKSHHNVGGLPKDLPFCGVVEPLRYLFKDEVRKLGEELDLPHEMVWRQPFPGPGLAIRIIGDITEEKLQIVRDSDLILRQEIAKNNLTDKASQYFTVLTGLRSVGVMGDERSYDYTVAIRVVNTDDFMTADWVRMPYEVMDIISRRIVNEVRHVNRVVYDVTSKPPASIEWE